MKWIIMILYFLNVLSSKATYVSVPLHSKITPLKCDKVSEELVCSLSKVDEIEIGIDTSVAGRFVYNLRDIDERLFTSQDRLYVEIIDDNAPVITLSEKKTFIKEGFDPYECVASIEDDSEFVYETYLQDNTVTIVATDIYGNMSTISTDVEFITESEYEVMAYLGDDVLETIENYLVAENLSLDNIGIGIKDIKTNQYYYQNEHKQYIAGSSMKLPLSVLIYNGINEGKFTPSLTLEYKESHVTNGTTVVPLYHTIGDRIRLDTLLRYTLVPSDNIAANMLFDLLARQGSLQKQMTSFFGVTEEEIAVVNSNKITVHYMIRVLEELLDSNNLVKEKYKQLESHILSAYNGRYLKRNLSNVKIAHKCGFYNSNINDTGIVYKNGVPRYLISIYTQSYGKKDASNVTYAERYIAKINQLVYEYYELVDLGLIDD